MAHLPRSDGWWYIPKMSKLLYVDSNHIMVLYNNYKDFGITEEELDSWHKKWNIKSLYDCNEIGNYDEKEEELIYLAFKKGNYKIKEVFEMENNSEDIIKRRIICIEYLYIDKKELLDFLLLNKNIFKDYGVQLSCIKKKDIIGFNNIEEAIEYYDN